MSAEKFVRFLSAPEGNLTLFWPIEPEGERTHRIGQTIVDSANCKERMEARVGIEPTYKGFADLSLTTWVPRPILE